MKILNKIKIYIKPFLNWKFLVCYLITASWHLPVYFMIAYGFFSNTKWMYTIGMSIQGVLMLPVCQENLIQLPLAFVLNRVIFKNDEKCQKEINDMLWEAKKDFYFNILRIKIFTLKIRKKVLKNA